MKDYKQCPRCQSTRIVNNHCMQCKEQLSGITNSKVLKALGAVICVIVGLAIAGAIEQDTLVFFFN